MRRNIVDDLRYRAFFIIGRDDDTDLFIGRENTFLKVSRFTFSFIS